MDALEYDNCIDRLEKEVDRITAELAERDKELVEAKEEIESLNEKIDDLRECNIELDGMAFSNGEFYNKEYLKREAAEREPDELKAKFKACESSKGLRLYFDMLDKDRAAQKARDRQHVESYKLERDRLQSRLARYESALGLALMLLFKYEPPDSRAVSDEFVAMSAVHANLDNLDSCMAIINKAIEALKEDV